MSDLESTTSSKNMGKLSSKKKKRSNGNSYKKKNDRPTDYFMLTYLPDDGPNDTMEDKETIEKETMKRMAIFCIGILSVIEYDLPQWFRQLWMHFYHFHFHQLCKLPEKHPKSEIKNMIFLALKDIWPITKFNKKWIVFGSCSKTGEAQYVNYLKKSGNQIKQWKYDRIPESDRALLYHYEKDKGFDYGRNDDERQYSCQRVLEKELRTLGWKWSGITNTVWHKNNRKLRPWKMELIFFKIERYRVFVGKLGKFIKKLLYGANKYFPHLQQDID